MPNKEEITEFLGPEARVVQDGPGRFNIYVRIYEQDMWRYLPVVNVKDISTDGAISAAMGAVMDMDAATELAKTMLKTELKAQAVWQGAEGQLVTLP